MIAVSDNTAANLLIDAVGMDQVQETIAGLGLTKLALNRRFLGRLPGPGEPENYASAGDLRDLLLAIVTDEAASPERCAWMRDVLNQQQKRDRLARYLPAGVTFGGKYGSLPGYSHDSGLISTETGMLSIAVLTAGFTDPYAADAFIGDVGLAMLAEIE
jgi:beta-lactamase class A